MKKFTVTIQFVVETTDRHTAWLYSQDLCQKHLRDLATVTAVSMEPLPYPEDWIAINEPIRFTPRQQLVARLKEDHKVR